MFGPKKRFIVDSPAVRQSRLVSIYRNYLATADTLKFGDQLAGIYAPATLAKLLATGVVEVRRAAALALAILGDETTIEALGRALSDNDRGVRLAADDAFRVTVTRLASMPHHQQLLRIMHLNDGSNFEAALPLATNLTQQATDYAEAWHQLGIALEGVRDYAAAEEAFKRCLWRCRFHYLAWHGVARCRISLQCYLESLMPLDRATTISPDFETPRLQARALRRKLKISKRQP